MLPVSILIPVFINNTEQLKWLAECLESCNQDCEIVVYDDGSSLTREIEQIVRIHEVHGFVRGSRRMGVSYARNRCAHNSSSELLFPLDCDDAITPLAIQKLYTAWNGIPLYTDISKFGDEVVDYFKVLDFDCQHVQNIVGFTSVNVLHSKEQWRSLGGWREDIDFYEDGEYNARLFGRYCGKRYPEALVRYRQHAYQRTKSYADKAWKYSQAILSMIGEYDMPCPGCSKRHSASNFQGNSRMMASKNVQAAPVQTTSVQIGSSSTTLPLEFEGKVLAQYYGGKGSAKHYYRGPATKFPYNVTFGDFLYADPRDVVDEIVSGHLLVRVKRAEQPKPVETVVTAQAPVKVAVQSSPEPPKQVVPENISNILNAPEIKNTSVVEEQVIRKPSHKVMRESVGTQVENLPDISSMDPTTIMALDINVGDAQKLLKVELANKNRTTVKKWLRNRIKNEV